MHSLLVTHHKLPITNYQSQRANPVSWLQKKSDCSRPNAIPGAGLTFLGSFQHLYIWPGSGIKGSAQIASQYLTTDEQMDTDEH
jgi:hypothetical protein